MNMATHEATDNEVGAVDFCWSIPVTGMVSCWSRSDSAASPYQAFRSGFREGCKITLERGIPKEPSEIIHRSWDEALRFLRVWCCVGADSPNGLWSIYGARAGLAMMMNYPSPEYKKIADYDWFIDQFHQYVSRVGGTVKSWIHDEINVNQTIMIEQIEKLATFVRARSGIDLCLFDEAQSAMVKTLMKPPVYGIDPMVEG